MFPRPFYYITVFSEIIDRNALSPGNRCARIDYDTHTYCLSVPTDWSTVPTDESAPANGVSMLENLASPIDLGISPVVIDAVLVFPCVNWSLVGLYLKCLQAVEHFVGGFNCNHIAHEPSR